MQDVEPVAAPAPLPEQAAEGDAREAVPGAPGHLMGGERGGHVRPEAFGRVDRDPQPGVEPRQGGQEIALIFPGSRRLEFERGGVKADVHVMLQP